MPSSAVNDRKAKSEMPLSDSVPAWHAGFLRLFPGILQHARAEFCSLSAEARDEAVQEVICNAMMAYVRLVELRKEDVAYAAPLARYAVAQYRSGRRVSTRLNVRDVTSFYCQRRKGVVVERLDRWDDDNDCWREVLVEDRNCTPASRPGGQSDRFRPLAPIALTSSSHGCQDSGIGRENDGCGAPSATFPGAGQSAPAGTEGRLVAVSSTQTGNGCVVRLRLCKLCRSWGIATSGVLVRL